MPCQRQRDGCITDGSTDEPDDYNSLEFLELFKLRDEVYSNCGADAANCDLYNQKWSLVGALEWTHRSRCRQIYR